MESSIKDFFSKCDQIRRKLQICSHLLKKFLRQNFIFCAAIIIVIIINKFKTYDDTALFSTSFLRKGESWNLKQGDINVHNTHLSVFVKKANQMLIVNDNVS